jgi:hypothetical protein
MVNFSIQLLAELSAGAVLTYNVCLGGSSCREQSVSKQLFLEINICGEISAVRIFRCTQKSQDVARTVALPESIS